MLEYSKLAGKMANYTPKMGFYSKLTSIMLIGFKKYRTTKLYGCQVKQILMSSLILINVGRLK